ncbi:MAG: TonB-dependent receptor [Bacteroidota bacterium]
MNQIKHWILGAVLMFACLFTAHAQNATLRGKITDGSTGEVLVGATIQLQTMEGQIRGGAFSDIEGTYTVQPKVPAGQYRLVISFIGYLADTIDLTATAGQVVYNETLLFEEQVTTGEVIITARKTEAKSAVAFQKKQQNSVNAIDGVTFDLIQRTGDANVAAVTARVVGVTVEEGKYVSVRGLGDRYSLTMLNGAILPGLDPNKNTVQMDIFPSNLIDNVTVFKNFTPDLPANFTGGVVDIRTKDFPTSFTLEVRGSLGYNTQASLLDNFVGENLQDGENLAGLSDSRSLPSFISEDLNGALPTLPRTKAQLLLRGDQLETASRSFTSPLEPTFRNTGLNQNYNISIGNQHDIGKKGGSFGYIASVSYRRNFSAFTDGIRKLYRQLSPGATILSAQASFTGDRSEDETLLGGLVKLSYKPVPNHKFSVNLMRNQSGNAYGEVFEGPFVTSGANITLQTRTSGYIQRIVNIYQGQGEHAFGPKDNPDAIKADWIVSRSVAEQNEPDLRFFANEIDGNEFDINDGNGYSNPLRFYRFLNDDNLDARVNIQFELPGINTTNKSLLKVGGAITQKNRSFTETRYELNKGDDAASFQGSLAEYLADQNLYSVDIINDGNDFENLFEGLYYSEETLGGNIFSGTDNVNALYGMITLPIGNRFKIITGARYESTDIAITPEDSTIYEDIINVDSTATPGQLDLDDILPALNLIFTPVENMNIRAGYSRTLARPSLLEIAPFIRTPYIGGPDVVGNGNLQRTLIDNIDLRWEWFFTFSEKVAVSVFYKNFTNPIGLAADFSTQNLRFRYINRDTANVFGTEIEVKKNFGFIDERLEKLQLGFNASFIRSEQTLNDQERRIRLEFDPNALTTVPLFGQSPYVFNAELAYIDMGDDDSGIQASLSYNVFGPRLFSFGGVAPDIFEQPRPSLNFSISKRFGKMVNVRLRANNILNPKYQFTQTFLDTDYIFREYTIGASYSLGVTFRLNQQ